MSRFAPIAAACCLAAAVAIVPAQAEQDTPDRSDWFSPCQMTYLSLYERAVKAGHDAGANLVDDHDADCAETAESRARLRLWLNPPPEPVAESEPVEAAEPTYSGGSSNATVICESGGDYAANTGNGYYGGYQFDSQTWDAYGDPNYAEANEAPPAVQDAAAASVPYDAWPNC